MGDKYLSDVIDYERDIAPYLVIQVVAGVGAGKNTWVKKLAANYNVLFITSRKITADIQCSEMDASRIIEVEELKDVYNASTPCAHNSIGEYYGI